MANSDVGRSVNTLTLASQVSRAILRGVLQGVPQSGEALSSEAQLALDFGVSRQVIREALRLLISLGVVEARQGRPTRVAPYENWNQFAPELLEARKDIGQVSDIMLELLELRRVVEPEAALLAAERRIDGQVDLMAAAFHEMSTAVDNPVEFSAKDVEFHAAIIKATGNHLLVLLFKQLHPMLVLARTLSAISDRNGRLVANKEHEGILAAIKQGSSELARKRMTDHLKWTVLPQVNRSSLLDDSLMLRTGGGSTGGLTSNATHPVANPEKDSKRS